jgi:CelD/BcsL family acetyltransferase involved in cellulose biosynthesis
MRIEAASTLADLDRLRDDWLRLHARDTHATVFTSWWWLRAWAEVSPYPWRVLVARQDGSGRDGAVVGLLPVSPRGSHAAYRPDQVREIHAMGDPSADYRGLICDPQCEKAAIDAFAAHFASDRWWDRLILRDVLDDRVALLIDVLAAAEPALQVAQGNGQMCPLLELPDSWEAYLKCCLTQPSRKSLKKRLRIAEERGCHLRMLPDCRDAGAVDQQLETLLNISQLHGRSDSAHVERCRRIFRSCIEGACAEIAVLYLADHPIAVQGSFVDQQARTIRHYLAGFDDRFADLSPGRVLDAWCIRDAIGQGFRAVDFLRGDEPYKRQLGAQPRFTRNIVITRRRLASRVRSTLSGVRDWTGW